MVEKPNETWKWKRCDLQGAKSTSRDPLGERYEFDNTYWDPKYGEIFLNTVNPWKTILEARSDYGVQIDRQIWVKGQKTNQTV